MPARQLPVGGATDCEHEHQTDTQRRISLNVWLAQCQGLRQRQHRTEHKRHSPIARIEFEIPDLAGNLTRAAGLEGRDSTDHATATHYY